jgi:hypothetical protein
VFREITIHSFTIYPCLGLVAAKLLAGVFPVQEMLGIDEFVVGSSNPVVWSKCSCYCRSIGDVPMPITTWHLSLSARRMENSGRADWLLRNRKAAMAYKADFGFDWENSNHRSKHSAIPPSRLNWRAPCRFHRSRKSIDPRRNAAVRVESRMRTARAEIPEESPAEAAPARKGEKNRPLDRQEAVICWIFIIVITAGFVLFIAIA